MKKKVSSFFRSKTQLSWTGFIILILIIAFCFLLVISNYRKEIIQFKQNEKALNGKIEELTKENTSLKASLPNVIWAQSLHQPKLSSQEIQYL